jgi:cell division inhibitor SepF
MSVFDRFLNSIKLNDDDDLDDEEYLDEDEDALDDSRPARRFLAREEEDEPIFEEDAQPLKRPSRSLRQPRRSRSSLGTAQQPSAPSPKVSAFRPRRGAAASDEDSGSNNFSVCVIRPKSMEDALQIAQMLIVHCVVILNLEGLDLDVSQRIFDFASGACCASRGRLDKISNYIFVLTPHDVDITGEFQQILTGAFDPALDLDLSEDLR